MPVLSGKTNDQTELDENTSNLLFDRLVFGNQPGQFAE
jgi:hypothetical protein